MTARRRSTAFVEFVRVWGVVAGIVVVGFVATYQYVDDPPPRAIRIAAGVENGAYTAFAERYARLLADDGIALEVVPTAGSVENLALLRNGDVTLALVQGGSATAEDREHVQALGSLFLEPVWILTGAESRIRRLSDLKGGRVAVGTPGSGTHLLAMQLLSASGVTESSASLIRSDASEAGRLLSQGDADAMVLVTSPEAPFLQPLLRTPAITLFDFERAAAYSQVLPFLTPVVLSEGVLDLEENVPPQDTTLVAVAALLAARPDLNASLIPALLNTMTRVHESGGVLERRRQFPSVDFVDLPLNADAARYIRQGPSFLYRWLPYGTAVLLDRLKLLVLPLLALLIPLVRVAPPLYQWRIRSKIYRWYAVVREIDSMLQDESTAGRREALADRLSALENEVTSVSVPLAYTGELYHLRLHIGFLQEKLQSRGRSTSIPHPQRQDDTDGDARQ